MTQQQQHQSNQSRSKEAIDTAKQKAAEATDSVKHKASQALDMAEHRASSIADSQKGRAADNLSAVADAFRQTGDQLRNQDQGMVAHYTDRTADQVDRIAGYMRDHTIGDMLDDAEQLARREPELFLLGAFALGLLSTRFLKSSRRHTHDTGSSTSGRARHYASARQRHWASGYPSQEEIRAAGAAPNYGSDTRSSTYSAGSSRSYGTGPRMYDRRREES